MKKISDFEAQVLADLAELKTQMRALLGNGQPGRLRLLEQRVDASERFIQRAGGIGAVLATALTIANVLINYLRWKH
jgi:hypothetical protein